MGDKREPVSSTDTRYSYHDDRIARKLADPEYRAAFIAEVTRERDRYREALSELVKGWDALEWSDMGLELGEDPTWDAMDSALQAARGLLAEDFHGPYMESEIPDA